MDVEELPTHGGSLRVWLAHQGSADPAPAVETLLAAESAAGLETLAAYAGFQQRAEAAKHGLLEFLLQARRDGRRVLGYGAAAKGNTLLNYAASAPTCYLPWLIAPPANRANSCPAAISP